MNILIISSRAYPFVGGVEQVVENLARQFSRRHKVQVIASQMGEAQETLGQIPHSEVPIQRIWLNLPRSLPGLLAFPLRFPRSLSQLIATIHRLSPDSISYHFPDDSSIYVYLAHRTTKVPLTLDIHGNDLQVMGKNWWYRFWLKKLCLSAQQIIVHSRYIAEELAKFLPEVSEKVTIVPNGLNLKEFSSNTFVPKEHRYIMFVGRLVKKKGADILIRAFKQADLGDVPLLIGGEGGERRSLAQLARNANINFLGSLPHEQVIGYLKNALFAVMPSRIEPFGIVALETLAAGSPLIASRTGGLAELLENGQTCLFFENEDISGLARTMEKLFRDADLRAYLSDNGRELAQKYDWQNVAETYLGVLRAKL